MKGGGDAQASSHLVHIQPLLTIFHHVNRLCRFWSSHWNPLPSSRRIVRVLKYLRQNFARFRAYNPSLAD